MTGMEISFAIVALLLLLAWLWPRRDT